MSIVATRKPPPLMTMLIAVVSIAGVAWIVWGPSDDDFVREPDQFCAEPGIITETSGRTPEQAFSACMNSEGHDPELWDEADPSDTETRRFRPTSEEATPDVAVIEVALLKSGQWQVSGDC